MNSVLHNNKKLNDIRTVGQSSKLPDWFQQAIPDDITLRRIKLLKESNVNTVCQEAKCPNLSNCFKNLKFTFMILGNVCTRNCRFCAVEKFGSEKKFNLDLDEPLRIARMIKILGINYAVVTSVTRDDLADGGAKIFAQTIELIRSINRGIKIETLIPDFKGQISSIKLVLDAQPNVVAHNIETVLRLYKDLRPQANYRLSLDILGRIKELRPEINTKSSIMLGLGETEAEVISTLQDLRERKCDILILGQYLAPSPEHYPVKEFISIEQFERYRTLGLSLGFKAVLAGPLVRSSYQAEKIYREVINA
jgi:lipoic acid synthetase